MAAKTRRKPGRPRGVEKERVELRLDLKTLVRAVYVAEKKGFPSVQSWIISLVKKESRVRV